jgi:flagellar protein FliO/FliZ
MDFSVYLRFLVALVFVLGLIGAVAWGGRRLGVLGRYTRTRGEARRIGIVELLPVDAKRRLVLVRRDGIEHLVLLGPTQDVLIEQGIRPAEPVP